jgi:hypothetical protein
LLDREKQKELCETIRGYYPDPKPTVDVVLQNHLDAINDGEVSDEALDNI